MNTIRQGFNVKVNRLSEMVGSNSYVFSAWLFGLMMLLWGFWLMLPFKTFTDSPVYYVLDNLAHEFTWGVIAFVIGAAIMHFIIKKLATEASIMCLAAGYFWSLVGAAFLIGDTGNTGGVVYLTLAVYHFWLYKRLGHSKS
jgi:hypothetical protein